MSEGITYQNKDTISKIFAEKFGSKSLEVYGIHIPKIVRLLPTNLPSIEEGDVQQYLSYPQYGDSVPLTAGCRWDKERAD